MNQYSVWKYLLIIIIVAVGVIYALPNLYGEDPALQITSSRGFELPAELTTNIDDALMVEQISFKSREQQGNRLLYRFNNTEDQIKAADVVREAVGEQFVVALNLAHATPDTLRAFGGKPMTLGLDLQGGVHFLMQVDMDTARGQQLDRCVDDIRSVKEWFGDTVHVRELDDEEYPYQQLFNLLGGIKYDGWILLEASTKPEDRIAEMKKQLNLFHQLLEKAS